MLKTIIIKAGTKAAGLYIYLGPRWDALCGRYQLSQITNKGTGCRIAGKGTFCNREQITFGNNVHLGGNCYFEGRGGITIGDHTHTSRNLIIYTENHDIHGQALPYDANFNTKPVTIGKCVWIGMNVSITPGVTIGDGAVIGMGTTVSHDVPAYAIVVGAQSRIVKMRDKDHYEKLFRQGRFWGRDGIINVNRITGPP